jgi:hypothetical protein
MSGKRGPVYWVLNLLGTLLLLVGPFSALVLLLLFLRGYRAGLAPAKDMHRLTLFALDSGILWVPTVAAVALGSITAWKRRSRWGAGIAWSAVVIVVAIYL